MTDVAIRKRRIGGSDMGDLFSLPPYGCQRKLWYKYHGEKWDYDNIYMARGRDLESLVLQKIKAKYPNWKIQRWGKEYVHKTLPLIGHVDFLIRKEEEERAIGEIKTITTKWRELPEAYILQVQLYMHLSNRLTGHIFSLAVQEWEMQEYYLEYDKEIAEQIEEKTAEFLRLKEPPPPLPPWDERCQQCPFREKCHGEVEIPEKAEIAETAEIAEKLITLKEATEVRKEAEKVEKEIKNELKEYMFSREINAIFLNDLSFYVSLSPVQKQMLDSKKLKEEKPEIYNQYQKQVTYWKFEAKKPSKKLLAEIREKQLKGGV